MPVEKGPFGKVTNRRSMSRSKTATPATKEDILQQSNQRYQDEVFSRFFSSQEETEKSSSQPQTSDALVQATRSPPQTSRAAVNIASDNPPASQDHLAQLNKHQITTAYSEPAEVLIYGYGVDHQPAAISFFENSSRGRIYEDYERQSVAPRYTSISSALRSPIPRNLPTEFKARINQYKGGDHWIKVTFNSPEAAELACHVSPHVINGFSVYAEPWHGSGPPSDTAVVATRDGVTNTGGGAQVQGLTQEEYNPGSGQAPSAPSFLQPHDVPNAGINGPGSSAATSKNNASTSARTKSFGDSNNSLRQRNQPGNTSASSSSLNKPRFPAHDDDKQVAQDHETVREDARRPMSVVGARRIQLQPASSALMPVPPWTQRMFGHLPVIGSLFGGQMRQSQVIGVELPRNDKGEFDWEKASIWWRACWWLDTWFGTDLCGMKGED